MQKYLILGSTDIEELIKLVNDKIDDGFLPVGGLSFVVPDFFSNSKILVCQPMLHYSANSIAKTQVLVHSNTGLSGGRPAERPESSEPSGSSTP